MRTTYLKIIFLTISIALSLGNLNAQNEVDIIKIEEFVIQTMEENKVVGSALTICNSEKELLTKGFGKTRDSGTPVNKNTPFQVASMTKSFTAIAIFQLAELGKLNLDDPVVKHLPEYRTKNKALSDQITIQHLLNHNSGFTTVQGNRTAASDYDEPDALNVVVQDHKNLTLKHNPGDHFEYSNANYQILGLLIEHLSKLPYEEYVTTNILRRLEMNDSGFYPSNNSAFPHVYVFGLPYAYKNKLSRLHVAQGGLYASVQDMQKYLKAMMTRDTTLISSRSYQTIFEDSPTRGNRYGYAGWSRRSLKTSEKEVEVLWHGGNNAGMNSSMFLIPSMDLGISVLANTRSTYGLNSTDPLCYGPISISLGMSPPSHAHLTGIIMIVLWMIPLLLLWTIWRKWKRSGKKESLLKLIGGSIIALSTCYVLLKFLPNRFGGVEFTTVLRFEPEIGFLLLISCLLIFILVITGWVLYYKKTTANHPHKP